MNSRRLIRSPSQHEDHEAQRITSRWSSHSPRVKMLRRKCEAWRVTARRQTRSFGEVVPMSGLPESGGGGTVLLRPRQRHALCQLLFDQRDPVRLHAQAAQVGPGSPPDFTQRLGIVQAILADRGHVTDLFLHRLPAGIDHAAELHAHFIAGGTVADGVRLVELLERGALENGGDAFLVLFPRARMQKSDHRLCLRTSHERPPQPPT
jgi:hypothetical protein